MSAPTGPLGNRIAGQRDPQCDVGVFAVGPRKAFVEPADVYHAKSGDFLTSHTLNDFRRCPLMYRKKELGLVPERDTAAYLIGRAAHSLILEGRERYERECHEGEGRRGPQARRAAVLMTIWHDVDGSSRFRRRVGRRWSRL